MTTSVVSGVAYPRDLTALASELAAMGGNVAIPRQQVTTIAIGNSIAAQSKWSGTYWGTYGELMVANTLCGSPMRFKRMTATTRMDLFGVYGYSGQTLPTIIADLEAQVWSQLRTSACVPEIVVGLALLENDIASGATTAAMILSLTQFIRDAQARFPGCILLLCTPRPSFSNNTAAEVLTYQEMTAYTLTLDNGRNIFVARCDGYENPDSPGTPLGTSGSPIYTDATVHPNAKGALVNARNIAAALARISLVWRTAYATNGTNTALGGTGAASGTNVSGTVPTSTTVSGSANATSFVCSAEQPGFLQTITVPVSAAPNPADISTFNFGAHSLSGVTEISPYMVVQIVSGGENLHSMELAPRINDGGGNNFQYYIQNQTGDAQPDYVTGDILTLRTPPFIAASASITACTVYGRARMKYQGGATTFRVLSQGIGIVS